MVQRKRPAVKKGESHPVPCPRCGSQDTRLVRRFGRPLVDGQLQCLACKRRFTVVDTKKVASWNELLSSGVLACPRCRSKVRRAAERLQCDNCGWPEPYIKAAEPTPEPAFEPLPIELEPIAQDLFKALKLHPWGVTDDKGVWHDSWAEKGAVRSALARAYHAGRSTT